MGGMHGTERTEPIHYDVIMVGAGISGIGMAWHLRQSLPQKTFAVLEARDGIGGTWDLFKYPGIRSDSDLHTYGFGFEPWTDEDSIASGDKIMRYLHRTVDEHDLLRHITFGVKVDRFEWSTPDRCWTVYAHTTSGGAPRVYTCSWLVATTGYFRYEGGHQPEFAGLEAFRGAFVHPQHWPEDLDVDGKRVVVIGSGATAVTLVPALAARGAHVTMLQRSPTYYMTLPRQDPVAKLLYKVLPTEKAYAWTREKNRRTGDAFYRLCRARPDTMKRLLVKNAAKRLPDHFDIETHFTPRYGPWDQRVCFVPNSDFFRAFSDHGAEVATDTVESFMAHGLRLASGSEIEADIVVSATGLHLRAFGGIETVVDGEVMHPGDRIVYKSVMLSDVPNFAFVFGYTNASWTLKVDLVCEWLCRCLAHMDRMGYAEALPSNDDPAMPTKPMLELDAGYVRRAVDDFPKQGTGPWSVEMRYEVDRQRLRHDPVDDGVLRFSRNRVASETAVTTT
jgi:cation diffusion facilitator CzcD-associated flavoprotein CzcO